MSLICRNYDKKQKQLFKNKNDFSCKKEIYTWNPIIIARFYPGTIKGASMAKKEMIISIWLSCFKLNFLNNTKNKGKEKTQHFISIKIVHNMSNKKSCQTDIMTVGIIGIVGITKT